MKTIVTKALKINFKQCRKMRREIVKIQQDFILNENSLYKTCFRTNSITISGFMNNKRHRNSLNVTYYV